MTLEILEKERQIFNKTWAFCSPFILENKGLPKLLDNYSVIAMGIKDRNVPDLFPKNSLGLLINYRESMLIAKNKGNKLSIKHPAILEDYYFGELIYGKLHMLVIEIPKQFEGAYYKFQEGKYSEMFKKPELIYKSKTTIIANGIKANCLEVCKKDKKLKSRLEKNLGVTIPDGTELDSIPNPKKEIFNYA